MAAIYFEMVTAVVVFVVVQAIRMALLSLKPVKGKIDGMLNIVFSRLIIYKSAVFVGNQEHAVQESSSS